MLNQKDKKVLLAFASAVKSGYPQARIWAFGSRAKGSASRESDLDVCVVLDKLDDKIDKTIIDYAWDVGFRNDRLISTVTYSKNEFYNGPCSQSSLVKTILDEGIPA